jgi:hypothetical protein
VTFELGDRVYVCSPLSGRVSPHVKEIFQIGAEALDGRREKIGSGVVKVRDVDTGEISLVSTSRLTFAEGALAA